MGQEINHTGFSEEDFRQFAQCLARETADLRQLAREGRLAEAGCVLGFELEAWLVDHAGFPTPINEEYLARLADPAVVRELSRFNVELNGPPIDMRAGALRAMACSLTEAWRHCQEVAHGMDAVLAMVGILPNLRASDLSLDNMSAMKRFTALNKQVQSLRRGVPIHIDIEGAERLEMSRSDVMLEAATTSFQVHLQVPFSRAGRYYNAALIGCGPLLAAAANSPILFGRRLWHETRIPLFEQSVELGGMSGLDDAGVRRVTFGQGYVGDDITELFQENQGLYPVLLPTLQTEGKGAFPHLCLHNGTIWRWVRPLVGQDASGNLHIRLEQRVLPSGPTVLDMVANAALHLGLTQALAAMPERPEWALDFAQARANFYAAARHGLDAELVWLDGKRHAARRLLLDVCLPLARQGLHDLGAAPDESEDYLEIVALRVRSGQTGAVWQVANLARERGDVGRMMANYLENQRTGLPVHEWGA